MKYYILIHTEVPCFITSGDEDVLNDPELAAFDTSEAAEAVARDQMLCKHYGCTILPWDYGPPDGLTVRYEDG